MVVAARSSAAVAWRLAAVWCVASTSAPASGGPSSAAPPCTATGSRDQLSTNHSSPAPPSSARTRRGAAASPGSWHTHTLYFLFTQEFLFKASLGAIKWRKIKLTLNKWRGCMETLLAKHKDDLWLTNKKSSTVVRFSSPHVWWLMWNAESSGGFWV